MIVKYTVDIEVAHQTTLTKFMRLFNSTETAERRMLKIGDVVYVNGMLTKGDGFNGFYKLHAACHFHPDRIDGVSVIEFNDGTQAELIVIPPIKL